MYKYTHQGQTIISTLRFRYLMQTINEHSVIGIMDNIPNLRPKTQLGTHFVPFVVLLYCGRVHSLLFVPECSAEILVHLGCYVSSSSGADMQRLLNCMDLDTDMCQERTLHQAV